MLNPGVENTANLGANAQESNHYSHGSLHNGKGRRVFLLRSDSSRNTQILHDIILVVVPGKFLDTRLPCLLALRPGICCEHYTTR